MHFSYSFNSNVPPAEQIILKKKFIDDYNFMIFLEKKCFTSRTNLFENISILVISVYMNCSAGGTMLFFVSDFMVIY